jgi:hypothetical protein
MPDADRNIKEALMICDQNHWSLQGQLCRPRGFNRPSHPVQMKEEEEITDLDNPLMQLGIEWA